MKDWHESSGEEVSFPPMINWVITFMLLAVVCAAMGFFGTEAEFAGHSAYILAGCFSAVALILWFVNRIRRPRLH